MGNETHWNDLKKLRLNSFEDETGKTCWSFYYNDLKKLFSKKKNKWAEKSNDKIIKTISDSIGKEKK